MTRNLLPCATRGAITATILFAGLATGVASPPAFEHEGAQRRGVYEGPGDTVPPGDDEHDIDRCDMLIGDACMAEPGCDTLQWRPLELRCEWPAFNATEAVWAQTWVLDAETLVRAIRLGDACIDEYGHLTAVITSPFPVQEVHVFESDWINGYDRSVPIEQDVPATVCVDGELLMACWPFDELVKVRDCTTSTVTVSIEAGCLAEALHDWAASGIDPAAWRNKWLFAVDFVSCAPCETDPYDPTPRD